VTDIHDVQAFWDRRPCNFKHSNKPVGSSEYFQEVTARKRLVEPHTPSWAEFTSWNGRRVLEIGCGLGTDAVAYASWGARVTAVDVSANSLELCRKRAWRYGLSDKINCVWANAERLSHSLPVQPYDLIYSFGAVHHTPDPEKALQQMRKYAKPGTALKLMVYHRRSWKVLEILLRRGKFWNLKELIARHSEAQTGCPVTHTYTRREARELVERAGWRVTDLRVDHIFPYRVKDYVEGRYVKRWPWSWLGYETTRRIERRLGWHILITGVVK